MKAGSTDYRVATAGFDSLCPHDEKIIIIKPKVWKRRFL